MLASCYISQASFSILTHQALAALGTSDGGERIAKLIVLLRTGWRTALYIVPASLVERRVPDKTGLLDASLVLRLPFAFLALA